MLLEIRELGFQYAELSHGIRMSLLPGILRETPETLAVEAEAGLCYFLRALWREDERSWRSYRVYLARVTAAEGEREAAIRRLILPTK